MRNIRRSSFGTPDNQTQGWSRQKQIPDVIRRRCGPIGRLDLGSCPRVVILFREKFCLRRFLAIGVTPHLDVAFQAIAIRTAEEDFPGSVGEPELSKPAPLRTATKAQVRKSVFRRVDRQTRLDEVSR